MKYYDGNSVSEEQFSFNQNYGRVWCWLLRQSRTGKSTFVDDYYGDEVDTNGKKYDKRVEGKMKWTMILIIFIVKKSGAVSV